MVFRLLLALPALLAFSPAQAGSSEALTLLKIPVEVDLSDYCEEALLLPRFTEPYLEEKQLGQFRVRKSIDPVRQEARIDILMPSGGSFEWRGKSYEVPPVELRLFDTPDLHEIFAEVYGAAYANHADYSKPPKTEIIGSGGYRQVLRSPFDPRKVVKLSTKGSIEASDVELMSLGLDHARATFVPQVLADVFRPYGLKVSIPEAPAQRPGATKGANAALEQPEVKSAKSLRDFLPELYEAHGDLFPTYKFPKLQAQLRALNLNRNLGLFGLDAKMRATVEKVAPQYALKPEVPGSARAGKLNELEELDRVLSIVNMRFIPADRGLLTAPRIVFDEAGLPMVRRNKKGELTLVTQQSMYGLDLNARNILVTPVRESVTNEIIDYQLHVIDN